MTCIWMIGISRVRKYELKEVTDIPKANNTSRKYSWGRRNEKGKDIKMLCLRLWPVQWVIAKLRTMIRTKHEGMQKG